jgi:hypothetical protein
MFIASSITSPLAPFEGAEGSWTFYHSRITPLLRTEPEGCCAAFYRHLTPNRGETLTPRSSALCRPSQTQ